VYPFELHYFFKKWLSFHHQYRELDEYAGNKSADHIHLIILESKML